ncbi:hypothetical protein GRI44_02555 [Altererythrobacter confluentis]|uniref:SPW repeat-containing protein n=1 Tax=Allopontixanthobacter confluentis TaxID=1849021 RepID=A0A6L7GEJ4_9SPHN|nr:hypothetical protein [Allopontixanthobacter confluentis]MXP13634.1 hypothetical protein [Allopontixanthobacter confluentis]
MRIQTLGRALAIAAGLLGAAHLALTPLAYPNWTIDALWFVGSGLAIVVAAAANFDGFGKTGLRSRLFVALINIAMSCFFAAAWLVLPEPQVIIGGVLFLGLAACSLPARKVRPVAS